MRFSEFITEDDDLASPETIKQMQQAYDSLSKKVVMGILQANTARDLSKIFPEINKTFYTNPHLPGRDKVIIEYLRINLGVFGRLLRKKNITNKQVRALRQRFFILKHKNRSRNAFNPAAKSFDKVSGKFWAGSILLDAFERYVSLK